MVSGTNGVFPNVPVPLMVPIIAPCQTKADFYNLLQAVEDHKLQFWDIDVGWPGKVHDARVFANSSLFRKGLSGRLFPAWTEDFLGCTCTFNNHR